jgi:ECF transporter S component (folate family)
MDRVSTKRIVLSGLMIAMVFITTRFTAIPVGIGYFNIGDVAIMLAAALLGRNGGFLAGAIGSALSDVLSAYSYYAPITFFVKGIEGYVMGLMLNKMDNRITRKRGLIRIIAITIGVSVMVTGYFLCDIFVLRFVGQSYGVTTALTNLPTNLVQAGASIVVGYICTTAFDNIKSKRVLI